MMGNLHKAESVFSQSHKSSPGFVQVASQLSYEPPFDTLIFIGNTVIGFGGITMNMDERNKKYRPDIEKHPVTGNLQKDSAVLFDLFEGCSDLKYNEIHLGTEHNISCIVAFIETTVENMLLDETVLGKMLTMLCTMKK